MSQCPSRETLHALATAQLDGDTEAQVSEHLERCPQCQRELDELPLIAEQPAVRLPQIDGYQVTALLGTGSIGVVYLALQVATGSLVALKMLKRDLFAEATERQRFAREIRALSQLDHANIVRILDHGEHDGSPYLAMEFLAGGTLASRLAGKPRPASEATRLLLALAEAVQHAHERGIIHRDLKPANILLQNETTKDTNHTKEEKAEEESRRPTESLGSSLSSSLSCGSCLSWLSPKIADFGLAKPTRGDTVTLNGGIVGTPEYMAPEQLAGGPEAVGPAADIYALGAILYALATGRPPFRGASLVKTFDLVRLQDYPLAPRLLNPHWPRDLETICLKCLEKNPARRYATAADLAADLRRFQAEEPIQARPAPAWERGWKRARRKPALAIGVAALVLLTVGSLVYAVNMRAARARADQEHLRAELNLGQAHDALERLVKRIGNPGNIDVPEMHEARKELLDDLHGLCTGLMEEGANASPATRYYQAWAFLAQGELLTGSRRFEEAEKSFEIGLPRLQQLIDDFPEDAKYREQWGRSQLALGQLYENQHRLDEAEKVYREAADYWEQAGNRPVKECAQLAELYNRLARLSGTRRAEQAVTNYQKGQGLLEAWLREDKESRDAKSGLALFHFNQGELAGELGHSADAQAQFRKAADLLETMPHDRQAYRQYLYILVAAYNGIMLAATDPAQQEAYGKKAVGLAEEIDQRFPGNFLSGDWLAKSRFNLANFYRSHNKPKNAEALLLPIVAFYEQTPDDPTQGPYYRSMLVRSLDLLSIIQAVTKGPQQCEITNRRALNLAEELSAQFPTDIAVAITLGGCALRLAELQGDRNAEDARQTLERAISALNRVHETDPRQAECRRFLSTIHAALANTLFHLRRRADAVVNLHRAMEVCNEMDRAHTRILAAYVMLSNWEHREALAEAGDLVNTASFSAQDLDELAELAQAFAGAAQRIAFCQFMRSAKETDPLSFLPPIASERLEFLVDMESLLAPLPYWASLVPDRRHKLASLYDEAALALIDRLRQAGYFQNPSHRQQLSTVNAFQRLRTRKSFQLARGAPAGH
jgi:serine/threonine protein kinase